MMNAKYIWQLLIDTGRRWYEANTFQMGAALAFYTVFSLAPLVLIAIAGAGVFFGEEAARQQINEEIARLAGEQVSASFDQMMRIINESGSGLMATSVGVLLLIVGATSVFTQLQTALNTVWGVESKPGDGIFTMLIGRAWTFAMLLVIGFLLLVSLVLSAVLAAVARWMHPETLPGGPYLWEGLNAVVSFGLTTLLFAMIYKVLPEAETRWRDVWIGAAVTSLLFAIGKHLIGLYLGQNTLVSAYGAAGSLVLILLWVYYSSQILLLGAEFTCVLGRRSQGDRPPEVGTPARPESARLERSAW